MSVLNNYICPFAKNFLLLSLELFTAHMTLILVLTDLFRTLQQKTYQKLLETVKITEHF